MEVRKTKYDFSPSKMKTGELTNLFPFTIQFPQFRYLDLKYSTILHKFKENLLNSMKTIILQN